MKRQWFSFWLLLLLKSILYAQTDNSGLHMDFEAYDPPSTLVVPEHIITRAKFPFIDIHSHQWGMADQDLNILQREMDLMNMSILINLSGRGGEQLKAIMNNIDKYASNRFAVFTNIDFNNADQKEWAAKTIQQLEADVKNGAKGLKVFKSLGMGNTDSKGNRIAIDDPMLDAVWSKCAQLDIPVLIHSADPRSFWSEPDNLNERWLELKTHPRRKRSDSDPAPWEQIINEQHNVFKKHPSTRFIAAHMGWLANDLQELARLLDTIPNMYVGIGAIIAELGRQPRMAKKFFIKYQDRILFGKDSYKPEEFPTYFRVLESDDEYFPYYKRYHAYWKMYGLDLPDQVLKKVYYKNALKIIPGLDNSLFPE